MLKALKPGGIIYVSFKHGDGERTKGRRLFNDYTEASFSALVAKLVDAECIDCWQTQDLRLARAGEMWLNGLLRRRSLS